MKEGEVKLTPAKRVHIVRLKVVKESSLLYKKCSIRSPEDRDSPYLKLSQRSEKMHRDAVRDWLAKISKDIAFHLHPHLFRHTFFTRLLKVTDLTTVSKLAGHSNVNMTARSYIHTTRKEKQAAVEKTLITLIKGENWMRRIQTMRDIHV